MRIYRREVRGRSVSDAMSLICLACTEMATRIFSSGRVKSRISSSSMVEGLFLIGLGPLGYSGWMVPTVLSHIWQVGGEGYFFLKKVTKIWSLFVCEKTLVSPRYSSKNGPKNNLKSCVIELLPKSAILGACLHQKSGLQSSG